MNDRIYLIGQALAGMCASSNDDTGFTDIAMNAVAIGEAASALAAAGNGDTYTASKKASLAEEKTMLAEVEELRAEIARLRDELARYTEPLTDEQRSEVNRISLCPFVGPATVRVNGAAIRKVRAGKDSSFVDSVCPRCADYQAEIALLKRQAEPLTEEEG